MVPVVLTVYAHGGEYAVGKTQCAQIRRREGFSFALVVCGRICANHSATLYVRVLGAQLALVYRLEGCHVTKLTHSS